MNVSVVGTRIATGGIKNPGRAVRQGGSKEKLREDSWNGMPPIPDGGNIVGGGARATNDGCRAFIPRETACPSKVHRVRGGDGARVAGSSSKDVAREGNGQVTTLRNHTPQRRSMYLQDGFPNRQGTKELPRQGVSGTGGNTDVDAG